MMEPDLCGGRVFISASFPSGSRADDWPEADPGAIAETVTAAVRSVLGLGGRVLFGGHPTITPLVLLVAAEVGVRDRVEVYQSLWFEGEIPASVARLESIGAGTTVWTAARASLSQSLLGMRREMFEARDIRGGIFVGGMNGVPEEHHMFGEDLPGKPRLPVTMPGGAAATLEADSTAPTELRDLLATSRRYPFVMAEVVTYLAQQSN